MVSPLHKVKWSLWMATLVRFGISNIFSSFLLRQFSVPQILLLLNTLGSRFSWYHYYEDALNYCVT